MGTPRRRHTLKNKYYHIYNRGNRKQLIYLDDKDYSRFLGSMFRFLVEYDLHLIGYCLMPNHFHLIVLTGEGPEQLSQFMQRFLLSYVMYFNKRHDLIGHLFQSPYKSKMFEAENLKVLKEYIRRNPVKAGLSSKGEHYKWVEVL